MPESEPTTASPFSNGARVRFRKGMTGLVFVIDGATMTPDLSRAWDSTPRPYVWLRQVGAGGQVTDQTRSAYVDQIECVGSPVSGGHRAGD